MFKIHRDIVHVGWIRAVSEDMRERLQELGVEGKMIWEQENPAFGTFEYCQMTEENLKMLYTLVVGKEVDIQIGGFTGIYKGTDEQVPRKLQFFWKLPRSPASSGFVKRHGYVWNTAPGVGYERIDKHRCPACGKHLRKGIQDEFIAYLACSLDVKEDDVRLAFKEYLI